MHAHGLASARSQCAYTYTQGYRPLCLRVHTRAHTGHAHNSMMSSIASVHTQPCTVLHNRSIHAHMNSIRPGIYTYIHPGGSYPQAHTARPRTNTHTCLSSTHTRTPNSILLSKYTRSMHTTTYPCTCTRTHMHTHAHPMDVVSCNTPQCRVPLLRTHLCADRGIGVHVLQARGVKNMSGSVAKVSYAGPSSAPSQKLKGTKQRAPGVTKDKQAWNTKIITGKKSKRSNVMDTNSLSVADRARVPIANKIFTGYCEFVASCTDMDHIPKHTGAVEIAVLGRSNVGKSSLLNALMSREKLVKTAKRPGHTKKLNFFRVGPNKANAETVRLVDMPGHGHASKEEWMDLIGNYLRTGRCALVLVLISAEHGLKETDKLALRLVAKIRHPADLQTNEKYPHTHSKTGTMIPHPFHYAQEKSDTTGESGPDLNIESGARKNGKGRRHATAETQGLGVGDFTYLRTMVVLTKEDKVSVTARRKAEMEVNAFLHELNISTAPLSVTANVPIEVLLSEFDPTSANSDIISASAREKTGIEEARLAIINKLRLY
ncbi:hypothetical protein SARC_06569 [Sphaeroforma arctica JP610]|uniref:G domain-containing protein n=1 Tax=Sphaeroforma arctica JP610 TaxID=667725 RepID=A0A0L0FWU4_9EUKA|nr:hypothetical protein SARC_06569 [Sphaeroforma arctica JP610]KNC81089.1 hypothetical protein SARC_06569 [Sphaeroforma arctica JP610]|eukprot:XP_014154991.1 hypothetical protein SARC_06569 [Sphaeroforma arctica JP610]